MVHPHLQGAFCFYNKFIISVHTAICARGMHRAGKERSAQELATQELQVSLEEAQFQNERLRSTLAMMRAEMEALQAAAAAAAEDVAMPEDVAVLKAELQVSTRTSLRTCDLVRSFVKLI